MAERRYVVGFLFSPDESHVLLALKTRPAWQVGKFNGIGGHVEAGESFDAGMMREAAEEAGLDVAWIAFAILENPSGHNGVTLTDPWVMHCYRATGNVHDLPDASDVGEELHLVPVKHVAEGSVLTIPNLRWLVPMAHPNDAHNWPYRITERAALMEPVQP